MARSLLRLNPMKNLSLSGVLLAFILSSSASAELLCSSIFTTRLDADSDSFTQEFFARLKEQQRREAETNPDPRSNPQPNPDSNSKPHRERLDPHSPTFTQDFFARLKSQENEINNSTAVQRYEQFTEDILEVQPSGFISKLAEIFTKKSPTLKIPIKNGFLSDVQKMLLIEHLRENKFKFGKLNGIVILNPEIVFQGPNQSKIIYNSFQSKWSELDKVVISKSELDSNPHEVIGLIARDKFGNVLASSSAHGEVRHIPREVEIANWRNFWSKLKSSGNIHHLAFIEESHSHPYYEVGFSSDLKVTVQAYPLSPGDRGVSAENADSVIPNGVIYKATAAVANGYSYSEFYLNGESVTLEIYERFDELAPKFGIQH